MREKSGRKFNYLWVIVGSMFLSTMIGLGFCSSNRGLYLAPITEALQIKRSLYSFNDSIRFVTTAIINVFFGSLLAKIGYRKMLAAGFAALLASMLCYAFAGTIAVFYIGSMFLGLGVAWTSTTMIGSIISHWCSRNKGTIMGLVMAANGIGSAISTQIMTPIIYEEGNPFGYRNAYKLIALLVLITGILVVGLYRDKQEDTAPVVTGKKKAKSADWSGLAYRELWSKPFFYGAVLVTFCVGFVLQGVTAVSTASMKDAGLDAAYLASVLSIHAIALAVAKLLMGFLYDHLGLRGTMTICDVAGISAMLLLANVSNSAAGRAIAMTYGLVSCLALPLETIMLPLFTGALFGQREYNKILGLVVSVNTAGYAFGSPVFNLVYDRTGSYHSIFLVCAGVMAAVTVVTQLVILAGKREKQRILSAEAPEAPENP